MREGEVVKIVAVHLVLFGVTFPRLLLPSSLIVDGGEDDDVEYEQKAAQSDCHPQCSGVAVVFAGDLLQETLLCVLLVIVVVIMHLVQQGVLVGQRGVGFTLDVQLSGCGEERG